MREFQETDRQSLLKEEYFRLQEDFEDYDKRTLSIKGWVAAGSVVAVAQATNSKLLAPDLIFFLAVITASIWVLEATWKMFQQGFAGRIRTLEAYFRGDPTAVDPSPTPLQIYHSWFVFLWQDPPVYLYENDSRPRPIVLRFLKQAFHPFVALPYVPILAACWWMYCGLA